MENELLSNTITVDKNITETIFTTLFRDINYVYSLYRELHPEDKAVTVSNIGLETLESGSDNEAYNVLRFIADSDGTTRMIVVIEAKNMWSDDLTLRVFLYISEAYRRYMEMTGQSEYLEKKVSLPKPEIYIIYTGSKYISDEVSLSKTFFNGDSPLDLRIRVLNRFSKDTIHNNSVKKQD